MNQLPEKIRARIVQSGDGCWEWKGAKSSGYGYVRWEGRAARVHRVAYECARGAIPDGLVLDHLCRNRACCNPDHLEPVTNETNLSRNAWSLKAYCPQGHEYSLENTGVTKGSGWRYCKACNRRKASRYYHENIGVEREKRVDYRNANREQINARRRVARQRKAVGS